MKNSDHNPKVEFKFDISEFEQHCLKRVEQDAKEFAEKNGCEFTQEIHNHFLRNFLTKLKAIKNMHVPLKPKSKMIDNEFCRDLNTTQAYVIDETSEHLDASLHAFAREFGPAETLNMIALMREGFEVRFRDYANQMQNELEGVADEQ